MRFVLRTVSRGWPAERVLSRMTTDLALQALFSAVWRRKLKQKVMIHSDQGSQFTGKEWQASRKLGAPQCWGVVLAHAALGIPFVINTVTETLVEFDQSLTLAAANMGAKPVTRFFKVQMPFIQPGVVSGGLFAFITSFDEVVVVLFVGSAGKRRCRGKCSRAFANRPARPFWPLLRS